MKKYNERKQKEARLKRVVQSREGNRK